MRDALQDAGLPCELVRESSDADRRIDAQRPSLVVIPIDQVQRWAALLGQLSQVATGVPVLGAVSRDASIDFTAALALGVTDLVTYPCSTEDLVVRVASSMRAGRRNDRIPERVEPASPLATLRSVTEAAEQALLRTETAVPRGLLGVQGPLTAQTLELVRAHPETSAEIPEPLSRVGVPVAAVRAHHERLDGSGYPKGLRGRQVSFGAQVLAVVDCYAAMVRARPHRPELAPEAALAVLREEAAAGRLAGRLVDLLHEVITGR